MSDDEVMDMLEVTDTRHMVAIRGRDVALVIEPRTDEDSIGLLLTPAEAEKLAGDLKQAAEFLYNGTEMEFLNGLIVA